LKRTNHRKSVGKDNRTTSTTNSDWPLALMLDEVWLRARRVLVHELEASGLWMETASFNSLRTEQKGVGERLKRQLLREVLGESDYAFLSSETIFGSSNHHYRSKIPFVLAFGYELGGGLYDLLGGPSDQTATIGELCSIFNLGICTFDLICDHYPDLFAEFSEKFNESVILRLGKDAEACQTLAASANQVPTAELRLLLKIISWVFFELQRVAPARRQMAQREQQDAISQDLSLLLVDAYRAEINSATSREMSQADLIEISRSKSTLPFTIINQIAHTVAAPQDQETTRYVDLLASHIATIFWLADDLSDVVRDLQAAALNSILVQAGSKTRLAPDPAQDRSVLSRLLDGHYIEGVSEKIGKAISSVNRILACDKEHSDQAGHFRKVVLFYVRSWL